MMLRVLGQSTIARNFSTSSTLLANRAIVFQNAGKPSEVLSAVTYPTLPSPPPNTLNVRFILSPINPSDINAVEGVYPSKPEQTSELAPGVKLENPIFVPGNEGLAEVTEVGNGVTCLKKGDWIVLLKQQAGTWSSERTLNVEEVIKVPATLSNVNAATISVNPPTAYNMLQDFVDLKEGDWVMQNGANSAVGQAVIQIAARRGINTINFVRDRPNLDALKDELTALGANHVLTYDQIQDGAFRNQVKKEFTSGKPIRLMLNCVSGKETSLMARLLGQDSHIVSYGAMSKQPLSLPTSLFIFNNLKSHGFWQSHWYKSHSREERENLMKTIADLQLKEPEHEIVTLRAQDTDEVATEKVRAIMDKMTEGRYGKKILLNVEPPMDP